MSETARWYAVHTYSGYENKVAATIEKTVENRRLEELILAVRIPTEIVVETKDNVQKEHERKLFPGYVLIKMVMNDDSWHVVRNTRGVTGFVGPGSRPVALTDEEIDALGVDRREQIIPFQIGDTIRIIDGPFVGRDAVVEDINSGERLVMVKVTFMGRETVTELELDQVDTL